MRKLMIFEIVLCNWTVYLTQFKCILGILGRQEHLQIIIGASFSPLFDFGLYILDNSIRQEKKMSTLANLCFVLNFIMLPLMVHH